jgi:catechol 2,3-dioxygenase-like lactoylglutathione lyase family enzyme
MRVDAFDHVGLNVSDADASIRWYEDVLGLRRAYQEAWGDFPAVLETAAGGGVALFPRRPATVLPGVLDKADMRHVAFRVSRAGLDAARAELTAKGIPFRDWDFKAAWSVEFFDPDGNAIELTTYESSPESYLSSTACRSACVGGSPVAPGARPHPLRD